jgi:Outer membrane protein beta-barrel domain
MKKIYTVVLAAILFSASSFAQKGNNNIGVGADLSLLTGYFGTWYKPGIGAYAKGMYGIGDAGQVTFTTGFSVFKQKGSTHDFKATMSIVPLLAGYRHHFNDFFVEPQIGYGIYSSKVKEEGESFHDSNGAFTWAATAGYIFNRQIEVSARFQSASREGTSLGVFGLRVGYNFSLSDAK